MDYFIRLWRIDDQYAQRNSTYRELLSRIRVGLVTKSDCDILKKRKISFKGESFETRLNGLCDFNLPYRSFIAYLSCVWRS